MLCIEARGPEGLDHYTQIRNRLLNPLNRNDMGKSLSGLRWIWWIRWVKPMAGTTSLVAV